MSTEGSVALQRVGKSVAESLDALQDLGARDSPHASRELSLAITNIEQGLLWLRAACHDHLLEEIFGPKSEEARFHHAD